jgi:hypothetical protein
MSDKLKNLGPIVVTNTSNIVRARGRDARVQIAQNLSPSLQSHSFDAFDPQLVEKGLIWEKAMEHVAMPLAEIDERVIESENRVKEFMSSVAVDEGYVDNPDDVNWRFVYVRDSEWNRIAEQTNMKKAEIGGGMNSMLNSTIYINYPDKVELDERDLFQFQIRQLHEARHRVQDKVRWVRMDELAEAYDFEDELVPSSSIKFDRLAGAFSRLSPFVSRGIFGKLGDPVLEEIFAVGYTAENAHKVVDHDLFRAQAELAKQHNVELRYCTGLVIQKDGSPLVSYQSYFQIYEMLREKIPNILELMNNARRGVKGARSLFARSISQKFGGFALLGMLYATNNDRDALNLSQLMFVMQEWTKGRKVQNSLGLSNAELATRLFLSIRNKQPEK